MNKVSSIFVLVSFLAAVVFIVLNGTDSGALAFAGIAGIFSIPLSVLYVKCSSVWIRKCILGVAASVSAIGTAFIAYVALWGLNNMAETWREEMWVFIVGFALFASLTLYFFVQLFRRPAASVSSSS